MKTKKAKPSQFKIEKGIAIPPAFKAGDREKYPFRKMEIGDSFFCPLESRTRRQIAQLAYTTARELKKQGMPHTYQVRFFPILKGTRIWRVK